MADRDLLEEALELWQLSADAEASNRDEALDDIRFARRGEQWDQTIASTRRAEGRPMLTINRLPAFARQVINDARQNKPSITTRPATGGANKVTAQIFDGLIRHIQNQSSASVAYDTGIESSVYGGFGYWRVDVDYAHNDTFDLDVMIQPVFNPFSVYGDPSPEGYDSRDWTFAFVLADMDDDAFEAKYPGADACDWSDTQGIAGRWWMEDAVRVAEWWQRKEVATRVVKLANGNIVKADIYQREPMLQQIPVVGERDVRSYEVTHRVITAVDLLEEKKWAGSYIPIVPVYGDIVNIEGERFYQSLIRDAKDPQRMFNFWRTASTEIVALAPRVPYIGPRGSFTTDAEKWSTANRKSHAYLEYDPQPGQPPPQRQPLDGGVAAGALQEALNASDDMKAVMGLHDASLGAKSNETSGRAIFLRQKEGDTSTFHFIDNRDRAIEHTGRILVDLIPNVYTGDRIVTILTDDLKEHTVQLGVPVPELGGHVFDLTAGKYALVMKTGPAYTTKREEAAVQQIEFAKVSGTGGLIADLIAKNLDWPGSDEIAKRIENSLPPHVLGKAPPPEMQQLQQAMQQAQQIITQLQQENQVLKLEQKLNAADAKAKMAEVDVKDKEVAVKDKEVMVKNKELEVREIEAQVEGAKAIAEAQQVGIDRSVMQSMMSELKDEISKAAMPRKRKGRAIKQPDGSWQLEAEDTDGED